jgi:serine/threonine-protein kinase PknK
MSQILLRNRYRVLNRLGAGGVGSVFAVEELRQSESGGPRLALKALFTDGSQQSLVSSLRLEFRVLATMRHPLIARVYDFGSLPPASGLEGSQGRSGYFFTRDLVDGRDLEHYSSGLSIAEICLVCQRTAEVLDVLHRAGMVHGDFKPANVIVTDDGRPHLIDFGLVRSEGQDSIPSGTAAYLAPETLRGLLIDRRADLYALGISIYQLVSGDVPLPRASLGELITWHLDGEPLHLPQRPEVPEELDHIVFRLTHRDPERRYPSAAEAALALAEAAVAAGAAASRPAVTIFVPPAPGENLTEPLVELEQAVQRRTLQRAGGSTLITVEGDPGGGKTTLLQELAWRAQLAGVEVIRGELRTGDPRAYGVWTDLLAQVAGVVGTRHPLEDRRPGEADRYAIYQQISTYLSESATKVPLLLLLDSFEQADEETRAALRFVARTLASNDAVLIVAAHRPDDDIPRALDASLRLRLRPLAAADVTRMVTDASGRSDPALAARLHEHTGGNPLFVIDVLRRLGEAGWPANPDLQQLAPPQRLEDMYASRWRELPAEEQEVLLALAILGRPASGRLLLEVAEQASAATRSQIGLPIEPLEQKEWVDRRPDGAYAFRQGPAARMIYSQLDVETRRRFHLAAAIVLERSGQVDPVERTRHAIGAGRCDLALRTLDEAIGVLKGLGAHRSAIQLHEELLPLLDGQAERARAPQRELGELYRIVGDYEHAARHLTAAAERSAGHELAVTRVALARVHRAAGEVQLSLRVLEELLAGELGDAARVAALSEAAAAPIGLDRHEPVLQLVAEALQLLGADVERPQLVARAELRGRRAWSLGYLQRYDEATAEFQAALEDARAAGDGRVEGNILNLWASLALRQADYTRATSMYRGALECARSIGDVERVASIRYNLSTHHGWRGEYAACLGHVEESLRLFEAMGALQNAARARCGLGQLELKLGLYEQARATLRAAIQTSQQIGQRSSEALAMLLLSQVEGRRGRFAEARQGIAEARRLYLAIGRQPDAADALLDLADLELQSGDADEALRSIGQARGEFDLALVGWLRVRAAALEGRALARSGSDSQRRDAATVLDQVFLAGREVDSPELAWECHAAAMELADARGQALAATRHAVAAAKILEQMTEGLPPEAKSAFWQDERRRAVRDRAALNPQTAHLPPPPRAAEPRREPHVAETRKSQPHAILEATLPTLAQASPASASGSAPVPFDRVIASVEERVYRLLEIYRQVNSELDPERLLGLVMNTAVELTGAERGFLLLGASPAALRVEVAHNLDLEGETSNYSRSIAERVFTSGQPVITVSAHNDPRFKEYLSVHQLQLESVLCIPIHARGKTAGVLYMESRFQTGRFTPADQRLLMAFGDQVAIALTNARLLADNVRKAQELEKAKREIEALAEERGQQLTQRTAQLEEAQRDLAETRRRLESQPGLFGMVGRSAPMLRLFELVERVAPTDVSILIEGESGTGKEMVARAVHGHSERRSRRLVSVNCAAIPEGLLESELFGHVRGAFTGADRERKGLFTVASGGTLFLDEIGDMPARMQVDLLRALQEKTIRPVGAQDDVKVDVRVIAASNRPLATLVQKGSFREDLFYRLNVVTLRLPSLRERVEDVPLLVDHFLTAIAGQMKNPKKHLSRGALRRLMEYSWPGNVRQLEHTLMNAAILADGEALEEEDFTLAAPLPAASATSAARDLPPSDEDRRGREKRRMLEALESCGWNKSRAAEVLGMPRRTFYRRLAAYGIQ